jgi:integrase
VWHYRFQVAGVRVQKSTRLTRKGDAEVLADKAHQAALARANGGEPIPTLDDTFGMWLEVNAPIFSAHHVRGIKTTRRLHLYDLGSLRIDDLTTERIESARNKHLVNHARSSANHWLRHIKLVVNWAVKRGVISTLPWKLNHLKVQKRPRPTLPLSIALEWFGHIDRVARKSAIGTAIRLMFGIGLRESEAITARWEWFDWERRHYTPGITKGKEAEPIPLPTWLIEHLTPLRRAEGLVTAVDGKPLPTGFARQPMRKANSLCGISGITPHRLRGTFATLLSEQGVPIQTIQRIMRHKEWVTTMHYLEVNHELSQRGQAEIDRKMHNKWRESGEGLESSP